MTKQSKFAYLAGFMDGEGCFSIVKTYQIRRRVDGTKAKTIRYHLHIKIANTNEEVLNWISSNFGGVVYKKKIWRSDWKPRFDWQIIGNERMEKFILGILPYLIVKKQQAKVALEFARLHSQEDAEQRDALRQKMLKLNNSSQPHSKSLETNTLGTSPEVKIESELAGDCESAPVVTQVA